MVGDGDAVAVGVGQFCCSATTSSPMGPSSSDPAYADRATQAMVESHRAMPGLGAPVMVVERAWGTKEYLCQRRGKGGGGGGVTPVPVRPWRAV